MTSRTARLGRAYFDRSTEAVAVDLLACVLWRRSPEGVTAGRIVETEAYLDSTDRASHAAWSKRGQDVMHRAPGTVYIYRSYGIHWMFNIVAHAPGAVGAVLVRAVEPTEGIALMQRRRKIVDVRQLCSGPGKLCQAFSIGDALHKDDLTTSDAVWITPATNTLPIEMSERIGITKSSEMYLRFYEKDNRFVSAHRRGVPYSPKMLPSS